MILGVICILALMIYIPNVLRLHSRPEDLTYNITFWNYDMLSGSGKDLLSFSVSDNMLLSIVAYNRTFGIAVIVVSAVFLLMLIMKLCFRFMNNSDDRAPACCMVLIVFTALNLVKNLTTLFPHACEMPLLSFAGIDTIVFIGLLAVVQKGCMKK